MSTISPELLSAYRFHKARLVARWRPTRGGLKSLPTIFAGAALECARIDVAAGKRRYPDPIKPYPAVSWAAAEKIGNLPFPQYSTRGKAYVQSIEGAGLRYVGRVSLDGRRGAFDERESEGYYTDPYGDVSRDGTGLCWGVVYQLPARDGKARFAAGYIMGGCSEDLPTVDFGTVYQGEIGDNCSYEGARGNPAARDAATVADSMARIAAEQEREYQTAWQAGARYADHVERLAEIRKSVLATIADMKGACATLKALPDSLKARLRDSIESDLAERSRIFDAMATLASGDAENLAFWPRDERLRDAFNEGAGRTVLA